MDIAKDIQAYRMRRQHRLDSRGIRLDEEEAKKTGTRLPYALCKKEGIDTSGMTPSEAWQALESKTGAKAKDEYAKLRDRGTPRSGDMAFATSDNLEIGKTSYGAVTKKVLNQKAWEKEISDELSSLPKGAIVRSGSTKVIKLGNGIWGGEGSEYDPRYQMTGQDLAKTLQNHTLMYSKAPTFEIVRMKEKGNPKKIKAERLEYAKAAFPGEVKTIRNTKNYSDYEVEKGGKTARYRVYENIRGKRYGCPLSA